MDLRELPLDDLILDPNLNLRDRLDGFTVERYTEAWGQMPPVTVFEVEGRWLLADGFHRHAAAVQLGRRTVPAEVRTGTFADALDHAAEVLNAGHVLLTSSVAGRRVLPGSLYSCTKWAVTAMGEALRQEIAKTQIKVTLIEPGMVDTPFFDDSPTGALEADDIARAVMFALTQPPHVDVNEVLIRPINQPT